MMSMDIGTTNAMIAARQEAVARMLQEASQRSVVLVALGSMLVRLGEWLRRDVEMPRRIDGVMAPRRRPQVA